MSPEQRIERERLQESVSFGVLESLSFLALFCSPSLSPKDLPGFWLLILGTRFLWLFAPRFFARWPRSSSLSQRWREQGAVVFRGFVYQIPFWLAARFFPIHNGQEEFSEVAFVAQGLVLVIGLLLCPLSTHWLPGLLTIVAGLIWFEGLIGPQMLLSFAVGLSLLCLPRSRIRPGLGCELSGKLRLFAICVSLTWPISVALLADRSHGQASSSLGLLLVSWTIVMGLGWQIFSQSRQLNFGEASISTPRSDQAVQWIVVRQTIRPLIAWLPHTLLLVRSFVDLVTPIGILALWLSCVGMAGRGEIGRSTQRRWSVWAFALLWGTVFARNEERVAFLACALLSAWLMRVRAAQPRQILAPAGIPDLHLATQLRAGLWVPAPDDLKNRVLEASEPSVELDYELTGEAPQGFSARLMERLQRASDDSEGA